MKKMYFLLICWLSIATYAQERSNAYTAVETFFKAFHAKDSLAMKNSFMPQARLMRSVDRNGKAMLEENDLQGFIQAVASRKASPKWEEQLGTPVIQQHQNLATVWVPFRFYLDNNLSHCGYNAFTLVWDNKQWKILSLIDTATKECDQFTF